MTDSKMRAPRFVSILGLGFGDCGKGLFTDFLTRNWNADTIVRFNGGAQAGHNVVLPDGRHHTFSQFGAGTFVSGVETILASPVLVHPGGLLVEAEFLKRKGVNDALDRLNIDSRCRIVTPFHQAAGRLRELLQKENRHGTCGVGIGETVRYFLAHPDSTLYYNDLNFLNNSLEKAEEIRIKLLSEFSEIESKNEEAVRIELRILQDSGLAKDWLHSISPLTRKIIPSDEERIRKKLHSSQRTVFEGAQGILLDEYFGFHPHTTWSSTHADALDRLSEEWELPESISHFGVLRTYTTRHGEGPLPSYDPDLRFSEIHNLSEGWQGEFRFGHPDEVLIRYALSCAGNIKGLLVSHLDVFSKGNSLRWNRAYESDRMGREFSFLRMEEGDPSKIVAISPERRGDLQKQMQRTEFLRQAIPVYEKNPILSDSDFLERLKNATDLPVLFGSYGNTYETIKPIGALESVSRP
ncbi:adenylosuccinate synthetase [Leptospira wolffii]|uniref:adenylosuccinate synthetase n=1 Tax=Leptospira wolffii TaxID=409998 RepID=UPI0002E19CAE|nr:adenylosuccinate synthetase [Leptospira wolffii]EPG65451.1 adenylosuccinate synthase [Leptospira wolffii serovar Khorat str. Khorat-H2]